MKKIIFIFPKRASFIDLDISILAEKYIVIENTYNWKKKYNIPVYLLHQFFFLIKNIFTVDLIIVSFGGYWALLPVFIGKLFKKPTYIILHGTDCASFKEINYGSLRKSIMKFVLKISYKYAKYLLPVSEALIYSENNYFSNDKVIKQGVKYFFPENKTKTCVISNAVDYNKWRILSESKRIKNRFMTVLSEGQFLIKGGELIFDTAKLLPQFEFYFVGINIPKHLNNIPNNVFFLPKTTPDILLNLYNDSKYYLQLSIFEGFGVALCESMLCGCIPIVSRVNALPYIVSDTGYVLDKMSVDMLKDLLLRISNENNSDFGLKARDRVINNFSINNRRNKLYKVLEN